MSCTSCGCGSKVASRSTWGMSSGGGKHHHRHHDHHWSCSSGRGGWKAPQGGWSVDNPYASGSASEGEEEYRPAPRSRRSFLSDVDLAEEASPMRSMSSPRSSSPRSMTPSPVRSMSSPYLSDVEGASPMRSMSSPRSSSPMRSMSSPQSSSPMRSMTPTRPMSSPRSMMSGSEEEGYGSAEEEEYPMRRSQMPSSSSGEWVLPFDQPRREEGGGQGEQLPFDQLRSSLQRRNSWSSSGDHAPVLFSSPKGDRRRTSPSRQYRLRKTDKNISSVRKHKGCSSAGRYRESEGPFCGPAGGGCAGTYPVGSIARVRNALSRAWHAENPEGLRRCACARATKLGFTNFATCKNLSPSSARPRPHHKIGGERGEGPIKRSPMRSLKKEEI